MSNDARRNSALNAAANLKIHYARLEDINKFAPEIINHLRRGGTRNGAERNVAEIQQMLDKIPPSQKAGETIESAVSKVKEYLSDKDTSHIKSHNKGGSSHPNNIKWENRSLNRARGDRNMTSSEQIKLDIKTQFDNLAGAFKSGIQAAPKGAVIGAITTAPFSMLRNGLRVSRGEISAQEAFRETFQEVGMGAGVGAATAITVTTITTACPPIGVALMMISPGLLAIGGVGMIQEFFKILEDHKQQVKDYYESMTEQELEYLRQIEAELVYEHEKARSILDRQQEITETIINRPRDSGLQGALERYIDSKQIYQSLQKPSNSTQALKPFQSNSLPPITE